VRPRRSVTTTAFEEADLEPMILHPPAPRVVVLRGRVSTGHGHRSPCATHALLQTTLDRSKAPRVEAPSRDLFLFGLQESDARLQNMGGLGLAVDARPSPYQASARRADRSTRKLVSKSRVSAIAAASCFSATRRTSRSIDRPCLNRYAIAAHGLTAHVDAARTGKSSAAASRVRRVAPPRVARRARR
jgi:hypothetical protein